MSYSRYGEKNSGSVLSKILIAIIAIVAAGFLLHKIGAGSSAHRCEENPEQPGYCMLSANATDEVAIVVGNTQNTPNPALDFSADGELETILRDVFYSTPKNNTPKIYLVSAAGTNQPMSLEMKQHPAKNLSASENNFAILKRNLSKSLEQPATEAGADYLGGIIEAARTVSSAEHPAIIVIGSGYSDRGVLNFASDSILEKFWEDEENIATILDNNRSTKRPVLQGATVYWYNLGAVAAPQKDMNEYTDDMRDIYELALTQLGARQVSLNNKVLSADHLSSINSQYSVTPTFVKKLEVGDVFNVTENIGEFKPETAELKNTNDVRSALKSFANKFNSSANIKLKLTGYIAICVGDGSLSKQRAGVIKDILVSLGVPSDKITVDGKAGAPPEEDGEEMTCEENSSLPETERRTVKIEVVKE